MVRCERPPSLHQHRAIAEVADLEDRQLAAELPGIADRHQHHRAGCTRIEGRRSLIDHRAVAGAVRLDDTAERAAALDEHDSTVVAVEEGGRLRAHDGLEGVSLVFRGGQAGIGALALLQLSGADGARRIQHGAFHCEAREEVQRYRYEADQQQQERQAMIANSTAAKPRSSRRKRRVNSKARTCARCANPAIAGLPHARTSPLQKHARGVLKGP